MTQAANTTPTDPHAVARPLPTTAPPANYDESKAGSYTLPDPLRANDGQTVTRADQWPARRGEILDVFRREMFGRRPGRPEQLAFELLEENTRAMDGAATLKRIAIHSRHRGREHSFELILFLPNARPEPVPVFLHIQNRGPENCDPTRQQRSGNWPAEDVIARGYGVAAFLNRQLAPDNEEHWREGVVRLFEGDVDPKDRPADAWGALAAWSWGASRCMDYFETDPRVDAKRVAVLGHSRGGKTALWAGAEDERFALVISNGSGCGGAKISRRDFGESVRAINEKFPRWFCANFKQYNDRERELPFDQHMLIALVAPRAVYVASGSEDRWADPRGEYLSLAHASPVYALWGHAPIDPDAMPGVESPLVAGPRGHHIHAGPHGLTPYDWQRFMDFADSLWRTGSSNTAD